MIEMSWVMMLVPSGGGAGGVGVGPEGPEGLEGRAHRVLVTACVIVTLSVMPAMSTPTMAAAYS